MQNDKIHKLSARLGKKREDKIRNERGDITTDKTEIQDHKRLLWTNICQQISYPRRNW